MKRRTMVLTLCLVVCAMLICGCGSTDKVKLSPEHPVTITMWHNYGGQMQSTMDQLIDEFNLTLGREKGIIVSVTSVSAIKDIEASLQRIADGDPGAPEMPDITVAYPKTAMFLQEQELLATLDEQFTKEELEAYLPQFVEEGRLADGKLYVFPIAKSTEVLFVNQTLFDRFAAATGVTLESLSTFEGIANASVKYARWTDEKTPDIPDDGASFFTADAWFSIAMVGTAQMGGEFVDPQQLRTEAGTFRRIWEVLVPPASLAGYAVSDGYSSDMSKTGEIVCSTGSTAGILFYGDSITYPDNTIEAVEYTVLPFPVFAGGEKVALQRGAGMAVAKSTAEREYAAALFLKWVTQPQQNMRFVASTGYLPVTKMAFETNMAAEIENVTIENVRKLLETATLMFREYDFIMAPNYEQYDALSKDYETSIKQSMRDARALVLAGYDTEIASGTLFTLFVK